MKKFFAWTILFALLLTLTACGSGGYDTPEECAEMFTYAMVEKDMDLFDSCVHPSRQDYMKQTLSRNLSLSAKVLTEFHIKEVDYSSNPIIERCKVRMRVSYIDPQTGEITNDSPAVTVVKIDGLWYIEELH